MVAPIITGDGQLDATEWRDWNLNPQNRVSRDGIVEIQGANGSNPSYAIFSDIEAALSGGTSNFSVHSGASSPTEARLLVLDRVLRQMQASGQNAAQVEMAKTELQRQIRLAQREGISNGALARFMQAAGMSGALGGARASTLGGSGGEVQTQGPAQSLPQTPAGAAATPAAQSVFPPSGWAATTTGTPPFDPNAYGRALAMSEGMQRDWEGIGQNTNRGRQLMMLFFYFAKMAESGDMGAMYQFMKFITYIVSKDKAKQQIEMGKKLIELQDLSRQWTNRLMNLSTDANDPNASNELMRQMTLVKSETDAIATSQKLISQMMEEFAQVVETLTNTTKSALETSGRIMRTVSTMR